MRWSSSMTALASSVASSFGSRRPELDRQGTQDRLQAYVSSQVRQIGEVRPWVKCSTSFMVVAPLPGRDRARLREAREGAQVLVAVGLAHARVVERPVHVAVVLQRLHDVDQRLRLEEGQAAGGEVGDEGAE